MPDIQYLPISYLDSSFLSSLMEAEQNAWLDDLGWDYSPIRKILVSFIDQKLLPGYVAVHEKEAIGYTYFLINKKKGIVGSIYVTRTDPIQEITDELLTLTISGLKDAHQIQRVEAQIMPFNNLDFSGVFTRNGFCCFPRCFLDLDLNAFSRKSMPPSVGKIVPWKLTDLAPSAEIVFASYDNQPDATLCADYRTESGCEGYLRSIVENPGCGVFMPETSFMALDEENNPCGFVIGCRISDCVGMIPQIAVHPAYHGRKLGDALITKSFEKFKSMGFHKVSLTVTHDNRRAYEWYCRLGFKIRKDFWAFTWEL